MPEEDERQEHQTAFRYGDALRKRLDAWRLKQAGKPKRGPAIRLLLDKILTLEEKASKQ